MYKDILKKINMKKMCETTGLSYNIIKNYSIGRKKSLSYEYQKMILEYVENIKN